MHNHTLLACDIAERVWRVTKPQVKVPDTPSALRRLCRLHLCALALNAKPREFGENHAVRPHRAHPAPPPTPPNAALRFIPDLGGRRACRSSAGARISSGSTRSLGRSPEGGNACRWRHDRRGNSAYGWAPACLRAQLPIGNAPILSRLRCFARVMHPTRKSLAGHVAGYVRRTSISPATLPQRWWDARGGWKNLRGGNPSDGVGLRGEVDAG